MPGWFIHMNVANKVINDLQHNTRAGFYLGTDGPAASEIVRIAKSNPAYVALGSIGPDLFAFLPDFKPNWGINLIYKIMKFMEGLYDKIDPYIGVYENTVGPQLDRFNSIADALSGDTFNTISDAGNQMTRVFAIALEDFVISQYDWFSIFSSGVPKGYDEQTFFWSDMFHYRKTFEFGAGLWCNASSDEEKAYAIGWMTHIGTDVVGHSFVNQKCGGPFRLHWLRHHLIENHMDAYVYGRKFNNQSLCGAAQHVWIAFADDGSALPKSYDDFFNPQNRPTFDPSDKKADVDSKLPASIKNLIIRTMQDVYKDPNAPDYQPPGHKGQCADHPNILQEGYPKQSDTDVTDYYVTKIPDHGDIETAYFYLYKYLKMYTTEYYSMQPPDAPPIFPWPSLPTPPSGSNDGDGSSDASLSLWDIVCDIAAWIIFIGECLLYVPSLAAAAALGPATYTLREFVYQNVEIPLYNAWLSLHWILAITGYATPLPGEIAPALHTLGVGFQDQWGKLVADLNDLGGGLFGIPMATSEPSGSVNNEMYPRDVVSDPKSAIPTIPDAIVAPFDKDEGYSEFTRPWLWPRCDNTGDDVLVEKPGISVASPYTGGQDAYALMIDSPGDNTFREALEGATSPEDTKTIVNDNMPHNMPNKAHLGDPADYSAYVIARLTRNKPLNIANFNMDSDRGYGYLCWDWVRYEKIFAAPSAYKNAKDQHIYNAPIQAGTGWDSCDLLVNQPLPLPAEHDPSDKVHNYPVQIRYIDSEEKYSHGQ